MKNKLTRGEVILRDSKQTGKRLFANSLEDILDPSKNTLFVIRKGKFKKLH